MKKPNKQTLCVAAVLAGLLGLVVAAYFADTTVPDFHTTSVYSSRLFSPFGGSDKVEAFFFDFDQTLTIRHTYGDLILLECREVCQCECAQPEQLANFWKSMTNNIANATWAFGGNERLLALKNWFRALKGDGAHLRIVSASWYPVAAADWALFLQTIFDNVGIDVFDSRDIVAIDDPGTDGQLTCNGVPCTKGSVIANILSDDGLSKRQGLFYDDSPSNIKAAIGDVDYVDVASRNGITTGDMDYGTWRASSTRSLIYNVFQSVLGLYVVLVLVFVVVYRLGYVKGFTCWRKKKEEVPLLT